MTFDNGADPPWRRMDPPWKKYLDPPWKNPADAPAATNRIANLEWETNTRWPITRYVALDVVVPQMGSVVRCKMAP